MRCTCGTSAWEWQENPNAWYADHELCEGHRRLEERRREVMRTPSANDHAGVQFRLYRTPRED